MTSNCKATPGSSNHQTRRRTGNSLASRKIEVITLSDSDEDATTIDWDSSSSEDDIQVIEERIRKRASARQYHEKDKKIHSMIVENSSMKRFKNGGVSLRSTGNITKAVGLSVHDRFKKGRGTATKNTGKEIVRASGPSADRVKQGGASGKDNTRASSFSNKRHSLKEKHSGGYRNEDILRWIKNN